MTYASAEQFLFSIDNLPRREYMKDPRQCALYLQRMQLFLDLLGNPEKKIPHYIHVTGTSGKGSVSTYLSSILIAAGYTTGLTISPHPTHVRERWQVNGKPMTKKEFVTIIEELKPVLDTYVRVSPYDTLSFHEITTAIALLYFVKKNTAWAVVEVGCGGRYDASNILPHKDAAIITNIGLDHTQILGKRKTTIAYEKAGIICPDTIAFTMETNPRVLQVIEKECQKQQVPLKKIRPNTARMQTTTLSHTTFLYQNTSYSIPAFGAHQVNNATLVIEVAKQLGIHPTAIAAGLRRVVQPLRMEIISKKPLIILDSAHNEDKIKTTVAATSLLRATTKKKNLHLVVGFSGDKDIIRMVNSLSILQPKTIACTRNTVNIFRKVAHPKEIAAAFTKLFPTATVKIFLDPLDAFVWGQTKTRANDLLLVTGSTFVASEIRAAKKIN